MAEGMMETTEMAEEMTKAAEEIAERAARLEIQFRMQRMQIIEKLKGEPSPEEARKIDRLSVQILTCEMVLGLV